MERYLDWIIDEHEIVGGFFSNEDHIKVEAEIVPNIETLYTFLLDNGFASSSYSSLVAYIKDVRMSMSYMHDVTLRLSHLYDKDLEILNAVAEFCNKHRYKTKQSAWTRISAFTTGTSRTRKRVMNKIKDWIKDNLPNLREELIKELKNKRLVPLDANPFCEILTKEL
ncbi:MAG: hypothetical protein IJV33_00945 [Bacteroidaceae bacterium]|nr:hypothetical protein [Bacteroidaceae bacterium]